MVALVDTPRNAVPRFIALTVSQLLAELCSRLGILGESSFAKGPKVLDALSRRCHGRRHGEQYISDYW